MHEPPIEFNPRILEWALKIEDRSLKELVNKLCIPEDEAKRLSTESKIQLDRLHAIADYLRFPSTTFFLPEPPYELELSHRKIAGTSQERPSKKVTRAIRKAYYWQSVAGELLEDGDLGNLEPKIEKYSIRDPVEQISHIQRDKLEFESIIASRPRSIDRHEHLYNELVKRIEQLNIFVYQLNMPVKEVRGFSLIDELPRVVVVNASDSARPKIFTLLHEYAHILLKTESVCFPNYSLNSDDPQGIESWCNDFAGSFLMPAEEFREKLEELEEEHEASRVIVNLASNFYSSKHAVLARIKRLNLDSKFSQDYSSMFEGTKEKELYKKGGVGIKRTDEEKEKKRISTCLNQRGRKFVKLVLDARERELITSSDIIDYLQLHPSSLDELRERL